MASRVYFANSATGRNTTTSAAFQDQVSLSFTPNASKTYAIFWSCVVDLATGTVAGARLYHDTAAAALQTFVPVLRDSSDLHAYQGVALYTSGGSPSSQTFKIQYVSGGSVVVGCREAYIFALELSANDLSSSTAATATNTGAYVGLNSVTPGAGDWIIIASAGYAHSTAVTNSQHRVQNTTDSTTLAEQTSGQSAGATQFYPFWSVNQVSLAGSKTFELQHARITAGTTSTRERTIIALLKSDFPATYAAENTADATLTGVGSNSPTDRTTLTETLAALDYLLLASFWVTLNNTNNSVLSDLTEDGVALTSLSREPKNTASTNIVQGFVGLVAPSAASHTYKIRRWNESTANTSTIRQANIHLLQLEDAGGASYEDSATLGFSVGVSSSAVLALLGSASLPAAAAIAGEPIQAALVDASLPAAAAIAGDAAGAYGTDAALAAAAGMAGAGGLSLSDGATLDASVALSGNQVGSYALSAELAAALGLAALAKGDLAGAILLSAGLALAGAASLQLSAAASLPVAADLAAAPLGSDLAAGASLALAAGIEPGSRLEALASLSLAVVVRLAATSELFYGPPLQVALAGDATLAAALLGTGQVQVALRADGATLVDFKGDGQVLVALRADGATLVELMGDGA